MLLEGSIVILKGLNTGSYQLNVLTKQDLGVRPPILGVRISAFIIRTEQEKCLLSSNTGAGDALALE